MFLPFSTICGNKCHNLHDALYGIILPSFGLKLLILPGNFDSVGLLLLGKLGYAFFSEENKD